MNKGKPYDQSGQTVIRPKPGGKRVGAQQSADAPPYQMQQPMSGGASDLSEQFTRRRRTVTGNTNAISLCATELLTLAANLKSSVSHSDLNHLRRHIISSLKKFSSFLLQQGYMPDVVQDASYAICTLLDETILNTPWGAHSTWGTQTLLAEFHGEAWGGENFFVKLDKFKSQPAANLDILEFYFICICLGLQGRYRVLDQGMSRLEAVREDLFQLIRQQKGGYERSLSLHWQGVKNLRSSLVHYTPWWIIAAVGCGLLLLIYLAFAWFSNAQSDPQFKRLDVIARETNPYAYEYISLLEHEPEFIEPPKQVKIEARKRSLKELLAPEIEQGLVEVFDRDGSVFIRTRGLFLSGSDQVMPGMVQLVERIGQELSSMQGHILISGHTDNVPIFNLRFPSNWALSKARAETVKGKLAEMIASDVSFAVEGRADNEPVVPNDTVEHKARNRRVEIIVTEK